MRRFFVITAIGKDRAGIVAGVSKALYDLGANIEDSSMTILSGEFAMILIVSTKEEVVASDFESHFKEVTNKLGLFISIKELNENEIQSKKLYSGIPYIISVIGTDKPGIVYKVSELLASKGINITDLNTKVIPGESAPVYTMLLEVDIPEYVAAPQVGYPLRIFVIDVSRKIGPKKNHGLLAIINPVLIYAEGEKMTKEGCLSIPAFLGNVKRATNVIVRGLNPEGNKVEVLSQGLEAIAIQHEVDHLNGVLFIHRVSSLASDLVRRKITYKDIKT